jgi:hypothetical protein
MLHIRNIIWKKNLIFKNKTHPYKRLKKKTVRPLLSFFFLLQLGWMTCSPPQIFLEKNRQRIV